MRGKAKNHPVYLLTDIHVALLLNVSVATIRNWRAVGGGPRFCRMGAGSIRYRLDDVIEYVAAKLRDEIPDQEER